MSFDFVKKVPCIGGDSNGTFTFFHKGFILGGKITPSWREVILSGVSPLVLSNAKADGLNYLKLFGGTELIPETYLDTVTLSGGTRQSNVPDGYIEVDGITNGGNKQINIGNSLNQDDEIELVFSYPTSGITQQQIYGYRESATANNISIFFSGTANRLVVDFNNSDYSAYRLTADLSPNTIYTVLASKSRRAIYQGNTLIAENTTVCNDTITIDVTNTRLFGVGGNPAYNNAYFTGTVYSLKVKNKRNMIACKRNSDNAVGFYNNVSSENFYTLQGGTAGADVNPTPTKPIDITCNNGILKINTGFLTAGDIRDGFGISSSNGNATPNENRCYIYPFPIKAGDVVELSTTAPSLIGGYLFLYSAAQVHTSNFLEAISASTETQVNGRYVRTATATRDGYAAWQGLADEATLLAAGWAMNINKTYGSVYIDGEQEVVTDNVGNTANAERLLAVGDYKDTQEVLSGAVTRNVGIKVLDGTENYDRNATNIFTLYADDSLYTSGRIALLSSHFVGTDKRNAEMPNNSIKLSTRSASTTHGYVFIKTDVTADSASDFKQWVADQYNAGTPVIIAYPATVTTSTVSKQLLQKSPVTQTAGSISGLPIAITESSHTTPTPQQPLQINCNNGVVGIDNQGNITVTGTVETVEIDTTGDTATAENLFKVGDYQDVQSVIDGSVTRNIGLYVLKGTENWSKSNSYTGAFVISSPNPPMGQKKSRDTTILNTHGTVATTITNFADNPIGTVYWYTAIYFKYDDGTDSVGDFKAWLTNQYNAGTPVILVYPLATPTTESVTGQPLSIQQGTNTVTITQASIDNLTLEVSYMAGVTVTITEVENANLSQNVEVTIS